jgi:acyl carrier protein
MLKNYSMCLVCVLKLMINQIVSEKLEVEDWEEPTPSTSKVEPFPLQDSLDPKESSKQSVDHIDSVLAVKSELDVSVESKANLEQPNDINNGQRSIANSASSSALGAADPEDSALA